MSIVAALHHVTHYSYDHPIALGMQTIRLRPAPHTRSHVQSYSLTIRPSEHFINWQQDPFGNYLARVVFPEKVREFRVEVDLVTEIRVFNPFDFFLEDYAKEFPFAYESGLKEELAPYLEIKERGPLLTQWLATVDRKPRSVIDFLVDINQHLNGALRYIVRLEPGVQGCEETLSLKSGSCRDMAWLLAQGLRHLGFATRFASGYLIQLKPDVRPLEGPAGAAEDFTDLHAWTEVYLPGAGWVGLDATSGLFAGEGHIPLCCTPMPSSAAPVSGTIEPCESTLAHEMTVTRMHEDPRVTRPFTDAQWKAIDALGDRVEKDLKARDIRLTMGGEPTFVSVDDRSGNEWHYEALGEKKKKLGHALFLRLAECFAPLSLRHYAQGKWYPGEILPRWAMGCHWRADGDPFWSDPALLADPAKDLGHGSADAKKVLEALAAVLGIDASYALPAQEDAAYYAWKKTTLPLKGDEEATDAYEKAERARIKALDKKLKEPAGFVLPLAFSHRRKGWISNRWQFSGAGLILLPGDSPVGLRLPLSSLPVVKETEEEQWPPRDPFEEVGALPKHASLLAAAAKGAKAPAFAKDANGLVRTALCAEARGGVVHLFLPPLAYAEHFLALAAAIETVAERLKMPLVLEGYPPPADRRLQSFSVTPDPGVIEVNVQPARDWTELKAITNAVYEEAHKARLTAEKFLLDGRRVGTGGGNHIVVGAAVSADSPFLRRPDMLRSLITFWQNHPSLSYLFSSMYIGPTSQSPRIDEARHDSLYELEIAFAQIPEKGEVSPWLVDRLLRNLLVDLTGNTHRAEFCIDKLFAPGEARGRLGLLEMRGFEMSPHPQMNLLQALLVRAAIAHFWQAPYRQKLVRWGTQLHDKFMLPHYVAEDLNAALHTLEGGGYDLRPDWFEPFFTFRFPHYGAVQLGEVRLELRMALEPWPVLGEEVAAGGTSRSVDSSVERAQVTVRGMTEGRHAAICNGRRLPLMKTAEEGTYVAGVRYKAWAPSSSLHPNIPVHTPLVFDVVDLHAERSLGGCRYHVSHPGGRNYDIFPVNENEAEGRSLSRFEPMGHTPGSIAPPAHELNPDFPHTLDLRVTV